MWLLLWSLARFCPSGESQNANGFLCGFLSVSPGPREAEKAARVVEGNAVVFCPPPEARQRRCTASERSAKMRSALEFGEASNVFIPSESHTIGVLFGWFA